MADVFISYHEESAGDMAQQIAAALENVGISCWYAEQDLTIPLVFADEIEKQIHNCKIFLLILNKESIQSAHVRNEVGLAFQRINNHEQMALMPVRVERCALSGALNYYLNTFQITDVIPPNEQNIRKLVKRVSIALGRNEPKKPISVVRRKNPWLRIVIALITVFYILGGSVAYLAYKTVLACAYVSLDVQETSIEFSINRMGRVITVHHISSNKDSLILSLQVGLNTKNKTVADAVNYAINTFKDWGYFDGTNGEIIASVTSNTEKRSMELTQTVAQTLEVNKMDGVKFYLMEASNVDRIAALSRNVSPGRYLIQLSNMNTLQPRRDTDSSVPVAAPETTPEEPEELWVSHPVPTPDEGETTGSVSRAKP